MNLAASPLGLLIARVLGEAHEPLTLNEVARAVRAAKAPTSVVRDTLDAMVAGGFVQVIDGRYATAGLDFPSHARKRRGGGGAYTGAPPTGAIHVRPRGKSFFEIHLYDGSWQARDRLPNVMGNRQVHYLPSTRQGLGEAVRWTHDWMDAFPPHQGAIAYISEATSGGHITIFQAVEGTGIHAGKWNAIRDDTGKVEPEDERRKRVRAETKRERVFIEAPVAELAPEGTGRKNKAFVKTREGLKPVHVLSRHDGLFVAKTYGDPKILRQKGQEYALVHEASGATIRFFPSRSEAERCGSTIAGRPELRGLLERGVEGDPQAGKSFLRALKTEGW